MIVYGPNEACDEFMDELRERYAEENSHREDSLRRALCRKESPEALPVLQKISWLHGGRHTRSLASVARRNRMDNESYQIVYDPRSTNNH